MDLTEKRTLAIQTLPTFSLNMSMRRDKRSSAPLASSEEELSLRPKKRKSVACQRCHTQKVKCSGEKPCTRCLRAGLAAECNYPARDCKVKVTQSYLDSLLAENRRLSQQLAALQKNPTTTYDEPTSSTAGDGNTDVKNPLVGERPWFENHESSLTPIYIGEAACSAFAARLRQFLANEKTPSHITRVEYTNDAKLLAIGKDEEAKWPDLAQAQLLVKVALNHISTVYHIVLKKSTLDELESIYQTARFDDLITNAKYSALFALGEVYSARTSQSHSLSVPGLAHFARALGMVRILPERPSIAYIETLLLLALFSFFLDRRHSGYVLISNAVRHGMTMGLNHNISESKLVDPVERAHRVRLWWTTYILDREWSLRLGYPVQALDEDISVVIPTSVSLWETESFEDTEIFVAKIRQARIMGEIVTSLYTLREFKEPFLQRVLKLLKKLTAWVGSLPEGVNFDGQNSSKAKTLLHLSFNQAVIVTTRPTLFFLLTRLLKRGDTWKRNSSSNSDPSASTLTALIPLCEACIHAARNSYAMIMNQWIEGPFPLLNHFHAHCSFSVGLIQVVSGLMGECGYNSETNAANQNDRNAHISTDIGGLHVIMDILRTMSTSGNLAAAEYLKNLELVKSCLDNYRDQRNIDWQRDYAVDPQVTRIGDITAPSTVASTLSAIAVATGNLESLAFSTRRTTSGDNNNLQPYTGAERNVSAPPPPGTTAHRPILQDFFPMPDISLGGAMDTQQGSAFDEYARLDDAFFNWDPTGPLWPE